MPDEEKVEAVEGKDANGKKKSKFPKPKLSMIMVVVLIIVGIVLAGAISFFVAAKIAGDRTTVITVPAKKEPGMFVKIGDSKDGVIVNIGGVTGRYLKIVMTLEVEPTKAADEKTLEITPQDEIKINDSVIKFLRSQKIDSFTPDKQDKLKEDIRNNVNATLGSNRVMDVFITNFVIQ